MTLGTRTDAKQTLALFFSDIEGSTAMLQTLGPAYSSVLMTHRELLSKVFDRHGGNEMGTEGDSFFVTFATASDAVHAAVDAQLALTNHRWPAGVQVNVRMGVHAGEVHWIGESAVGMAVHEAARIAGAAHGGQVLVSEAAAGLTPTLPPDTVWRELGSHQLKDIARPIALLQAVHPLLRTSFPPPRTHSSTRTNLPHQASAFIGRSEEIVTVQNLVTQSRLVTVTGAGGVGKTRLALRAVASLGGEFPDGIWFADLAPVNDHDAVEPTFIRACGSAEADLASTVGDKQLLIVVDNCEHLIDEVASVIDRTMSQCPRLTILATSREPLGLGAEVTWRMPSLNADDAVELFVTRARAVNSGLEVGDKTLATIREICTRLDSIPLALELAAARTKSLTVEQVAERLDHRFKLLSSGARGAMARQRTLQAAVDWSFNLLTEEEQKLLRRLGVFEGGFTLEAAEEVCSLDDIPADDVLDLIDSLVSKSLVTATTADGKPRFKMLETVRHYASDKMLDANETEATRDRHLEWFVDFAKRNFEGAFRELTEESLVIYSPEEANFFSAFEWGLKAGKPDLAVHGALFSSIWMIDSGNADRLLEGLRRVPRNNLAPEDRSLLDFAEQVAASNVEVGFGDTIARCRESITHMHRSIAPYLEPPHLCYLATKPGGVLDSYAGPVEQCEAALELLNQFPGMPILEAACLQGFSSVLYQRGEFERALEVGERCATALQPFGHRIDSMLTEIALAIPDPEYALRKGKSAFAAAKTRNDVRLAAQVAWPLRLAASMCGDEGFAEALGWEVLELGASTGNSHAQAIGHNMIGWYAYVAGDHDLAALHAELAVKLSPANTEIEIQARHTLAEHLRSVGQWSEAWRLANEAANLPSFATAPATAHIAILVVLALLLLDKGEAAKAAILAGAFPESYHTRHGIGHLLSRQVEIEEEVLNRAREALGTERYLELRAIGRALGPAGAIARLEDGEGAPLDYVREP